MSLFSDKFVKSTLFHPSTAWFLSQCSEARGMQEMWKNIRPQVLKKLKESALIQSTESSNRIEGVEVEKNRLAPLVFGKATPRDRSEEEIQGYRKALAYIHQKHADIEISPSSIKKLHEMAQGGMISDAGKWKTKNNDIIEILPNGERIVRFTPASAAQTPKLIEQLCLGYQDVTRNTQLPELISVANFVLEFLCIHPFRDGNGRVARLLTVLLLYKHNYEVGRYISLEKIIEQSKDDYYRVLKQSSEGWHEMHYNTLPWWNYFLGIIKTAYQDLKTRVEFTDGADNQSSLLKQSILSFDGFFRISDVQKIYPNIDRELIKKVLQGLKLAKQIKLTGSGRGAKWRVSMKNT